MAVAVNFASMAKPLQTMLVGGTLPPSHELLSSRVSILSRASRFSGMKSSRSLSQLQMLCSTTPNPNPGKAQAITKLEGSILQGQGLRFAVVAARFNEIITKPLVAGALEAFHKYAVKDEDIEVIWVPGSFEIPLVAQALAKTEKYEAILCIGAVIRGDTTHYDAVAGSAVSGIMSASLNSGVPCIFGILTCDTMDQAIDRAGGKVGNKGAESAITAIEMASLFKHHIGPRTKRDFL